MGRKKAASKEGYSCEGSVNFRPNPECMRELEEMWRAWGANRTEVIVRAIHTTYLVWKNGWNFTPTASAKQQVSTPVKRPLVVELD